MAERSFGPLPVFDPVTPCDLAQIFSRYRAWAKENYNIIPHPPTDFAAISEAGIETLVTVCYYASLQPEEGRYPRLHVVAGGNRRRPELVTAFSQPVPLTSADVLRKLAPAVASEFAISVREEENILKCEGFAMNLWERNFVFDPPRRVPLNNGMCIRIDGPGEVTICEEHLAYHTRGGPGVRAALGRRPWGQTLQSKQS